MQYNSNKHIYMETFIIPVGFNFLILTPLFSWNIAKVGI